jgi:hypothetical protein
MPSLDLIRLSLESQIDWAKFEAIVCDILAQDDMPNLRQLGGQGDHGIDAIQESFFSNSSTIDNVVQITSQKSQRLKLHQTLTRLKECGVNCKHLTIVFRDPCSGGIRRDLIASAAEASIRIDVRDQSYLITQLAKPGNGLFARHFEDARKQIDVLLSHKDPLETSDDRTQHAMLASLGAFVAEPGAKLARATLFDRTVLAVLVASKKPSTVETLQAELHRLLPGEDLPKEQIDAAIQRLRAQHLAKGSAEITPTETALASVGAVIVEMEKGYSSLINYVLEGVTKNHRLDDASKGRLERNCRRAIASLLRRIGPSTSVHEDAHKALNSRDTNIRTILSEGIDNSIARTTVATMIDATHCQEIQHVLASLGRSYAAMELRNMDPLGRRWQQSVLSRSTMLLDTDVVLSLIVEELPIHPPLLRALRALANSNVTLATTETVIDEVAIHFRNASKTFRKFELSLARLPREVVDSMVWHAIVKGFYYTREAKTRDNFLTYWNKYFDRKDTHEFVKFLLNKRLPRLQYIVPECDPADRSAKDQIAEFLLSGEANRMKAQYRDEEMRRKRSDDHAMLALHVSKISGTDGTQKPSGFVVSDDMIFQRIQRHPSWGRRPPIHLFSAAALSLAGIVCGTPLSDDEFVRCIFDPVLATAAEDIADAIKPLAEIGVDLRNVAFNRLEWDTKNIFEKDLLEYANNKESQSDSARILGGLVTTADDEGYQIDEGVRKVVSDYQALSNSGLAAKEQARALEQFVDKLVSSLSGPNNRTRRRVRRIIESLGGFPSFTAPTQ